jgi:hypothetical protein
MHVAVPQLRYTSPWREAELSRGTSLHSPPRQIYTPTPNYFISALCPFLVDAVLLITAQYQSVASGVVIPEEGDLFPPLALSLAACFVICLACHSILKAQAVYSSETSVCFCQTTRRHIREILISVFAYYLV